MKRYILVTETFSQGVIPSVYTEDGRPRLFESETEAQLTMMELFDYHIQDVQENREYAHSLIPEHVQGAERIAEIRQIIDDYQMDEHPMDWVIEVEVDELGTLKAGNWSWRHDQKPWSDNG